MGWRRTVSYNIETHFVLDICLIQNVFHFWEISWKNLHIYNVLTFEKRDVNIKKYRAEMKVENRVKKLLKKLKKFLKKVLTKNDIRVKIFFVPSNR